MTERDFRYIAPDGSEVQGWQLTETTRYQNKEWPEWMDSRWFMTVDGETWLDIGGTEMRVPDYSWIVKTETGDIQVVGYVAFEQYDKVVKEVIIETVDDNQAQSAAPEISGAPSAHADVLSELKVLFEVGEAGGAEAVHAELKAAISRYVSWCDCPPNQCQGGDRWSCRQNSPLVFK